jgi:hypothetical protein
MGCRTMVMVLEHTTVEVTDAGTVRLLPHSVHFLAVCCYLQVIAKLQTVRRASVF